MTSYSCFPRAAALPRVNRYILVVTPKQPYVDWVTSLDTEEPEPGDIVFSLEEAQRYHQTNYLVPYDWDSDPVVAWLDGNFDIFFQCELMGIEDDPSRWPTPRTLELFEAWFETELLDAPFDTTREPVFIKHKAKKRGRTR